VPMTPGGPVLALGENRPPRYIDPRREVKRTIPEDLAKGAGLAGHDASEQARFLLLLELYRENQLSLGRLAEHADLSQAALLERMASHDTCLNYSLQDLEEDRKTLP